MTASHNSEIYSKPCWKWCRAIDFLVLSLWMAVVVYQLSNHVMWRDEVRALSIALSGDSVVDMFRVLHGEGHPALWYLLLRATHGVVASEIHLQALSFGIACLSIVAIVFWSPFPWAIRYLIVGSHCFLFEYSVMARNYGISAMLMFAIVILYQKYQGKGILIGTLLFLLANTNVIGALMVVAFLAYWGIDTYKLSDRNCGRAAFRCFALNAVIATVGIIVCGFTILPTFNDAAARDYEAVSAIENAVLAIVNPAASSPGKVFNTLGLPISLGSAILYGAVLGLIRLPAAMVAGFLSLLLFALFSAIAAEGSERHALIWWCFVISLYWLSWSKIVDDLGNIRSFNAINYVAGAGLFCFCSLIFLQFAVGLQDLVATSRGKPVQSRSAELGQLLKSPRLRDAVVLAEPDYMVEALPYYAPNATYLLRENKYGKFSRFTRLGRLSVTLGDVLQSSQALQRDSGRSVIVVMAHDLKNLKRDQQYPEGYNWNFSASEAEISDFLSATELLVSFGPARTGETYSVYLLRDRAN